MALSTVFHCINSLDNSPLSHSALLVLFLPYCPFNYISLYESLLQPWYNPQRLTGLKTPTHLLTSHRDCSSKEIAPVIRQQKHQNNKPPPTHTHTHTCTQKTHIPPPHTHTRKKKGRNPPKKNALTEKWLRAPYTDEIISWQFDTITSTDGESQMWRKLTHKQSGSL